MFKLIVANDSWIMVALFEFARDFHYVPRPGCWSKSDFLRALDVRSIGRYRVDVGWVCSHMMHEYGENQLQNSKVAPISSKKRNFQVAISINRI